MVVPLLIGGVVVASAVAGYFAGSGQTNPSQVTNEAQFRNYSPTFAPTTTDARSIADSRILNYSPSVQIDSPNSSITKKEALTSNATARSDPTVTPKVSGASFQEERGTSSGLGIDPIYILGGALILGGAYYFTKK